MWACFGTVYLVFVNIQSDFVFFLSLYNVCTIFTLCLCILALLLTLWVISKTFLDPSMLSSRANCLPHWTFWPYPNVYAKIGPQINLKRVHLNSPLYSKWLWEDLSTAGGSWVISHAWTTHLPTVTQTCLSIFYIPLLQYTTRWNHETVNAVQK